MLWKETRLAKEMSEEDEEEAMERAIKESEVFVS